MDNYLAGFLDVCVCGKNMEWLFTLSPRPLGIVMYDS